MHTVTLSGWGSADRNEATNRGSSEYPEPLCQEWRRIMLRNLDDHWLASLWLLCTQEP